MHISTFSGDKLRYPVKRTPGDVIKATLFGKSSVRNAMSIYAYGSNALTERMTKDYCRITIHLGQENKKDEG